MLPPHSILAERMLLGSLMILEGKQPMIAGPMLNQLADVTFYAADHQILFNAMRAMNEAGKPLDPITVREWLTEASLLDEVGGMAGIAMILNAVARPQALAEYACIVYEQHNLRTEWRS